MEKQNLITAFALSPINEKENSIIGSTVVINNFELNLDKYTKNFSKKKNLKFKSRIIIKVINNYKEEENNNVILKDKFFIYKYYLNLGEYYITYSNIFFTKAFFNEVIQGKTLEFYDKVFIFEDLDWKGLVKKFSDLNITLSGGSTVLRHTLNIVQLKLFRFLSAIESEEEPAELIIKNSFKLSKVIHKKNLIETFSKDSKIWLIREKVRFYIKPELYLKFCKYLYLYNKYFPHLINIIFNEIDKPNLEVFSLHLRKMIKNEDFLPELSTLNEKKFSIPLQNFDLKHKNLYFKNIEELNKAIDIYKNNFKNSSPINKT